MTNEQYIKSMPTKIFSEFLLRLMEVEDNDIESSEVMLKFLETDFNKQFWGNLF